MKINIVIALNSSVFFSSVVSSMKTGPATTCMVSKRAWVPWSRAWGKGTDAWMGGINLSALLSYSRDMTSFRRRMYGPNLIDVPVKPYAKLLFEEVRWKICPFLYRAWLRLISLISEIFKWFILISLSLSTFFRSSTRSMCSKCSASPCGWPMTIIFTPCAFLLSPFSPSASRFMRSARYVCVWGGGGDASSDHTLLWVQLSTWIKK